MATSDTERWLSKGFKSRLRFMVVSRSTGADLRLLRGIKPRTLQLSWNDDTSIKESGTVDYAGRFNIGSDLLRVHLDAEFHDGSTATSTLGTYIVSTPERTANGSASRGTLQMYGRLQELADSQFMMPVTVPASADPVEVAAGFIRGQGLECVFEQTDYRLGAERTYGVGGDGDDSILDAVNDLLKYAGFRSAWTDGYGVVHLTKYREPSKSAPVWEFIEGANARFLSEVTEERDTHGVANVVRVTYSTQEKSFVGIARDDDPDSEFSTLNQGRTICRTESLSDVPDESTDEQIQKLVDDKAKELLGTEQSVIHRITLSTVWCPIRYGETARIEYPSADINGLFSIRTMSPTGEPGVLMDVELRRYER